jgi:lipoprotein signal peptidase
MSRRAIPRAAGLGTALLVLLADQASKAWIVHGLRLPELGSVRLLPFLSLTWVENRGITFGLLNGAGSLGSVLLTLVALAVVAALTVWLWRAERVLVALALGAIIGGAVGNNLFDRPRLGYVIDFVHLHAWGWSWYVFNLADAAIVCGVAALVLDGIIDRPSRHARRDCLEDAPDRRYKK